MIDRLSHDLTTAFPDMSGPVPPAISNTCASLPNSGRNRQIVQEALAQNHLVSQPGAHGKNAPVPKPRLWYAQQVIEKRLEPECARCTNRIKTVFNGKARQYITSTSPCRPTISDMAAQVFKDPYLFDFLGTADPRREREVEQALVKSHPTLFFWKWVPVLPLSAARFHLEVGRPGLLS